MKFLQVLALIVVIAAAINLGIAGYLRYDPLAQYVQQYGLEFRDFSAVQLLYMLVGVAGLYSLTALDRPLHLRRKQQAPKECPSC